MSGLEIAALAALGLGYIDAKLRFRNDFVMMRGAITSVVDFVIAKRNNRINMWYVFEKNVKSTPNKAFLVYPEPKLGTAASGPADGPDRDNLFHVRTYTYKETYDIVLRYASYLRKEHGIHAGDCVALDFVNKPEFIFVWFALWQLGATPAMINYNLQDASLRHCVLAAGSKLLIADNEIKEHVNTCADDLAKANVSIVVADAEHFRRVLSSYEPLLLTPDERGNPTASDPSCYIYTSGTTGLPKAAVMSWRKSIYGANLYAKINLMNKNDVFYSSMPLYHSTAAVLGLMTSLHTGCTYAIGHKFSTTTFWTQVKLSNATLIQYVGETCRYLLNAPSHPDERQHRVRQAMGNGLRPDIWRNFKERFNIARIAEFYGATEFPMAINNVQDGEWGVGSCGSFGSVVLNLMRLSKFDIARIDPDTQELYRDMSTGLCERAAENEPGEFLFKIDAKDISAEFQGYKGNEKATEEKVAFDVFKKGDAWVRTGDLLRLVDGCFYFVDRLGDTFRWKSENVSTNEVEEALTEDPHINECVVVGVKVPHHEGRAGFAVIEPRKAGALPDHAQLGKMLLKRLPRYAVPIFIKYVDQIPLTGNNKIQKKVYRDQKIPSENETIYWLQGDEYVPLTPEAWAVVEAGKAKF